MLLRTAFCLLLAFIFLALTPAASHAQVGFQPLWTLGNADASPMEFGGATGGNTSATASSAATLDDDFYLPGSYPVVGTVATAEPVTNFERQLDTWDVANRIHFTLSAAQAASSARLRVSFRMLWGGWWDAVNSVDGKDFGEHQITTRFNGQTVDVRTVRYDQVISVTFTATAGNAVAGANVLEISRTGGEAQGWVSMDFITAESEPDGLLDSDSDTLPRWWELEHGLSDTSAADASQDPDLDGRSSLQEFASQTHPRMKDSDADGLPDGTDPSPTLGDADADSVPDHEELAASASTVLADTDGDGAADAWELRTGYLPSLASSTPPAFSHGIALHFVSSVSPTNSLSPYEVTGLVPQPFWNNTIILSQWDADRASGSTANISSPSTGILVNSAGQATAMTVAWTTGLTWATGNSGGATQNLLNSGLWVNSDSVQPSITLSSIPYTTYDVLVYVGSSYDGARGYVQLNNNTANNRYFHTWSAAPVRELMEPVADSSTRPRMGNVIRYRNITGSSCTVKLYRLNYDELGIHGIQIVNSTADTDSDGLPDHWEVMHKLKAGIHDAALDPDADGLTHAQELARGTHPQQADTDGDGLSDAVETNTGSYLSSANTGSNPLLADTDGDSFSDGAEIARLPVATNPNLADTDGDGRSDAEENQYRTDPVSSTSSTAHMPTVSGTAPRTLTWDIHCQIVWDHLHGHTADTTWGARGMLWLTLANREAALNRNALAMQLSLVGDRVTYLMHTSAAGGFSYSNQPTSDLWLSDWADPPTDLKAALGFSGVGAVDISDRLRLRLQAVRASTANSWSVTMSVFNLDTNQTVVTSPTMTNCTAAYNIQDGSALTWTSSSEVDNRVGMTLHQGITLHFLTSSSATSVEDQPAYAAHKDTDEDGMPDVWETTHSFNPNSAADAALDADTDGLSNQREYLAGTLPRTADTDGDGASDGIEVAARSNPLLGTHKPPFWTGLPAGISGEDLNGNGMSDAWEWLHLRWDLLGSADADGDGVTNAQEAKAGTDPFSALSKLWLAGGKTGSSDFTLAWPRLLNKSHLAQWSDDLTTWTNAGSAPLVVGAEYQQTFPAALSSHPKRFYRATVNDLDSDGDGVSNWAEENVLHSATTDANSTRSAVSMDTNLDGSPDTTLSGDRATYLQTLQGAQAQGGFTGSNGGSSGISASQASRFLIQASFGSTLPEIARVQQLGYEAWINDQLNQPPTLQRSYMEGIFADFLGPRADPSYLANRDDNFIFGNNCTTAFARGAIQGPDQLRQRMAFALSQILVASRRDAALEGHPLGMADFYDIFIRHGLGNYYDVLYSVTLHPAMGRYLSHVGNQKANPAINQYPDENYAREVMQLFTIGLWELNNDGTRKLNGSSQHIPTYSNTEITQLARVLTGLWFAGHPWGQGGWNTLDYATPMVMDAERHDFGQKTLLNGYVIPARAPTQAAAMQDIQDAMRHLFEHGNTPPFVCKQLIQFLVTDNPSPAYVNRVASVFINNGSGIRGDLAAVAKAILLDPEAREPQHTLSSTQHGRLKEPVIRAISLARAFGLTSQQNLLWWDWHEFYDAARQEAGYSPSVFNFYRPEYKAPGLLTSLQRSGPVFQITDSYSSISFPNKLWQIVEEGFSNGTEYRQPLDLSRETALASTPEELVDHLNVLLCGGQLSVANRNSMLAAIQQVPAARAEARARLAIYLATVSPEGAVMR